MAIGPIDYSTGVDSPIKAFDDSLSAATNLQTKGLQNQALAQQLNQNASLMQDTRAVAANPTPEAIAQLSVKYPQLAANFKQSFDIMDSQQQQARLQSAIPIYSAVQSGNTDVAVGLLNKQADAYENAGRAQDATQSRTMAKLVQDHPEVAKTTMGLLLSGAMGPDKFATTFGTLGKEGRDQALQPAALAEATGKAQTAVAEGAVAPRTVALKNANVASEIGARTEDKQIARDKLTTDTQIKLQELQQKYGELPPGSLETANKAAQAAVAANQGATNYNSLADRVEQANASGGLVGKGIEAFKNLAGGQDAVTQLRQDYNRMRALGIAKALPVSRLTDNDIKLASAAFPDATASPSNIASFLRGMAKLQQVESATQNAQAEWIGANPNHSLTSAKTDIVVNGIKVPAGTPFAEFARQYVLQEANKLDQEQVNSTIANRSYMRYGQPAMGPR